MTISTYTELKAEVFGKDSFSHRTDLDAKADTFCILAESVINKDLRTLDMEKRISLSLTDAFYDLPSDYLEIRALHVDVDSARSPIKQVTPQILDARYSRATGNVAAFAIHGGQIEFRPAPTASTGEMTYFARVPTLTGIATNDILTNFPMIYLSAMLIQLFIYLQDDEQIALWTALYDSQIVQANKSSQGGRYVLPQVQVA